LEDNVSYTVEEAFKEIENDKKVSEQKKIKELEENYKCMIKTMCESYTGLRSALFDISCDGFNYNANSNMVKVTTTEKWANTLIDQWINNDPDLVFISGNFVTLLSEFVIRNRET